MAKDPVCGMDVDPHTATQKTHYQGQTYYFCAPGCREAFRGRPAEIPGSQLRASI
jgi:YHS domain-containing protein